MTDNDDVRDGLARALADAMEWNWGPEPGVPSPTEAMLDAADAALAYLAARPAVDVEAVTTARGLDALYTYSGDDPSLIIALRSAFRAGAEFAAEQIAALGVTAAPSPACSFCHAHPAEGETDDGESICTGCADEGAL